MADGSFFANDHWWPCPLYYRNETRDSSKCSCGESSAEVDRADDLTARLGYRADELDEHYNDSITVDFLREAADRIEADAARLERAEAERDRALAVIREAREFLGGYILQKLQDGGIESVDIIALDDLLSSVSGDGTAGDKLEPEWTDPEPWVYFDGKRRTEPLNQFPGNIFAVLWMHRPRTRAEYDTDTAGDGR